jgi:DNA-binding transcriptional ArsR family regulator
MEIMYTKKQVEIANQLMAVMDSKFFKSLGEPVRVEIIRFLLLNGRADIGTIAENMPQDRSVISRHLNLMHDVGILTCTKESRHMFYSLNGTAFLEKFTTITRLVETCLKECGPLCCK